MIIQAKKESASEKLGVADGEAEKILAPMANVWEAKPTAVSPNDTCDKASERRNE